jgi:hypothetical protein
MGTGEGSEKTKEMSGYEFRKQKLQTGKRVYWIT